MHVVSATDFSKPSEAAFAHALALALVHRADLTLVHVDASASASFDWSRFPGVRPRLARWGLLPEGAGREDVHRELGIDVRKLVVRGRDPAGKLLRRVDAEHPDVVVLAHRGTDGQFDLLRRSVAEAVARAAQVPTLVVPEGARGFVSLDDGSLHLHRILVGVDKKPAPGPALAEATRLVGDLVAAEAEIELFHVGAEADAPAIPDAVLPKARITRFARPGDPAEELPKRAAERDADLVVLATAGREGLMEVLRGSITERVLARLRTPLLAVPAG